MLPRLISAVRADSTYRGLLADLPPRGAVRTLAGLPGSSGAVLTAALLEDLPQRVILVVAPTPAVAERWLADFEVLAPGAARLYPQREALGEEEPHLEIAGEQTETIAAVLSGRVRIVVTTTRATAERTRMPEAVLATRFALRRGVDVRPAEVIARLEGMGYERRPSVVDVAQFAVRGGIVDAYGFGMASPIRLEWWGDELISIRRFDLDTQRSEAEVDEVTVLPVSSSAVGGRHDASASDGVGGDERAAARAVGSIADGRQTLLDLLPSDGLVVCAPGVGRSEVERLWQEAEHHLEVARRRGESVPGRDAILVSPDDWERSFLAFARLELDREPAVHRFPFSPAPAIERDIGELVRLAAHAPLLVLCDNEGQLERLEDLLAEPAGGGLPPAITLAIGALQGGFRLPGLTVLTDHEIFRRTRRLRRERRYRTAVVSPAARALTPGDYVVHLDHGIGVYRGMETIQLGGATLEVAVLEYEGGDRLNVPLYRIDQIEPYRSVSDDVDRPPPRLDRLGGTRWARQRERTERAVRQLAAELLDLYARRALAAAVPCPPDTRWQKELESSFLYEDTPDQRRASEEVKRDLEQPRPMDRLLVGDVGYGKTEVALRAAFKAIQGGRQAAILVPTTVLAEQHGRTCRERLAQFPIRVEVLSRFRAPAEVRAVLADLREGKVDLVVGTHRLLSRDVAFKDLGLLIVDEEHRFGVRHKERLKALRLEVHVLTLTATPIPRTLHQALSGLRDLSLIETPPRDRSPVLTYVEPWDDELLAEVLARELDRGGQAFFVHNRIETIEPVAGRVRRLAPRARVAVAHGQMRESELDDVMRRFVAGDVDVLVSTMIVESGLDVPNANTMVVHQAHQFGLAQLYQLRGRVGRGHRRAFCYLLVPETVDPQAEYRLKVLEQHTDLGSGYRIALRDLELRGAGNLLGAEQSGYAHAVGFDVYMRWLNDAVRAARGEAAGQGLPPPEVLYDGPAHLPDGFVPDEDAKLDLYRRLARAGRHDEIAAIRAELRDRFGPLPPEAEGLLVVSDLRVLGSRLGVQTVVIRGDEARLSFREEAAPRLAGLTAALDEVQFAADIRRVRPLVLHLTRVGGLATGPALVRALAAAAGDGSPSAGAPARETPLERGEPRRVAGATRSRESH
ncbi:MAG TPA: transcription-repair coupling factor [Gemmatimonadales bacterium]|nr:transcription-repair coupling factor [Gemmatimonadales bacterium]